MKRRVAVVTTSRAEYGLLYWLLRFLKDDARAELQLVAGGMHLSPAFGRTIDGIRRDGFRPAAVVDLLERGDDDAAVGRAIGKGVLGFTKAFAKLKPDVAVVLGDRFELLAACAAAVALRVPIAHLHGGEATEGVLDEQVRHAVTKMAHLHFVAAEPYRRRVVQMGEDPRRVILSGAPGLEAIARLDPMPRAELEARLGMPLTGPLALMTYHPTGAGRSEKELDAALGALKDCGARAVITYGNADSGGRRLNARLEAAARRSAGRWKAVPSLGQRAYLSLMRLSDVVFGNSSSGILEAPVVRVPTVNVGDRQDGRLRAPSVIDCAADRASMRRALARALSPRFRAACDGTTPYRGGRVAERIGRALLSGDLSLTKRFFDQTHRRSS